MIEVTLKAIVIISLAIATLLAVILATLLKKEKGLKEELVKVEEKNKFLKKIDDLSKSDKSSTEIVEELDKLSKDYFQNKYQINREEDYTEIRAIMSKRGEKEAAQFAQQMIRALYSGRKVRQSILQMIIQEFRDLVQPPILPKQKHNEEDSKFERKDEEYEAKETKKIKSIPTLPDARLQPASLPYFPPKQEEKEFVFPVLKHPSPEDTEESEKKENEKKDKEKIAKFTAKKESAINKELPVKLQQETAPKAAANDAPLITREEPTPEVKEERAKINPKKDLKIPAALYSHLR